MLREFAQKLFGRQSSTSTQVRKTFAEPVQPVSYLSELVVTDGKTANVCVVSVLINEKLERNHIRYHRWCLGNFPRDMVEAVRSMSDGQIVTLRKESVLEHIVQITGVLPLPSADNPWGSLAAKLNPQQRKNLEKLVVPHEPQPLTTPPSPTDTPSNG